ncbi:hypothetical protein [Pseudoxanthomonas sp. CF125]|jgi:hypothetical protein|uniref:hypothetical protein n=1 Tax=Pseudoxanthomonas sp. CF125 TaxID=1855303 RepID=UPI000B82CB9F|nr:hypothetical protein [Pseudoxanthomonas sp. CF125]
MKAFVKTSLLLALLVPGMALASTPPQPLELPKEMTITGSKFIVRCSDEAFSKATNPRVLAIRCQEMLAAWRQEAAWRQGLARGESGLVSRDIIPTLAIRGIPAYPPPAECGWHCDDRRLSDVPNVIV